MEKEIAKLIEEINSRTVLTRYADMNFGTMHLVCPDCGKDTSDFDFDDQSRIFCPYCGNYFHNIDFIGKHLTGKKPKDFSEADLLAIVKFCCRVLKIPNNLAQVTPEPEKAKKTATPKNTAENTPKTPVDAPLTSSGTFTPKDDTKAALKALFGDSKTKFFAERFQAYVDSNRQFEERKTGFWNLDNKLQCFQPGIYILGGLAALGKTTFALQLLEQMAHQGETCIYCSYEMSKGYLYSKLLAREIFNIESGGFNKDMNCFNHKVEYPLPASKVSFGNFKFHEDAYKEALQNFTAKQVPLYIWELSEVNIGKLLNRINNICNLLERPPIVCIDYLQLLTSGTDNPKTALDNALRQFFNFRRKTNTTFIIISSLNRMNYNTDISFEAFKESGAIEYSADVIWGLQLMVEGKTRTAAEVEKAKKAIPRKVQLKCLKNRFGSNFDVGFDYYPNCDTFVPLLEYGEYTDYQSKRELADEDIQDE